MSNEMKSGVPAWQTRNPRPSAEYPRDFLDPKLDLGDWESIRAVAEALLKRPLESAQDLERWIGHYAEFNNAVQEEESRRYIEMTCHTQDKNKEADYLHFVEKIEPNLAPLSDKLNRKLAGHDKTGELPQEQYGRWLQSVRTQMELFREDNIPLHTEVSKLSQKYQSVCGDMTVEWEGKTLTLGQMASKMESPDREIREKAWRLVAERRRQEAERLEEIFEGLFEKRKQIAANLGLPDFMEYSFKSYLRDYTPQDCRRFHDAVRETVVPRYRKILEDRRRKMGLGTLRPWDLACDPLGREPLRPFESTEKLVAGVGRIFENLDEELGGFFGAMVERGLLDLENRVGKAPGGYQCSLQEIRLPFIFMNAVGLDTDVYTLLHEGGHAFHQFFTRSFDLGFNRHAPMEFSEVASMAMERLGSAHLDVFYGPDEKRRSLQSQDEEVFRLFCWVALIDSFQHWMYTHPGHTRLERRAKWLELESIYGSDLDWSGLEGFREIAWHRQLHIFEVPFYYIEYGIAQMGALQVWVNSLRDRKEALKHYKNALRLGGTRGVKDLFRAAGGRFDLSDKGLKPLVEALWQQWETNHE